MEVAQAGGSGSHSIDGAARGDMPVLLNRLNAREHAGLRHTVSGQGHVIDAALTTRWLNNSTRVRQTGTGKDRRHSK
jgi:hypothetical protein